MCTHQGPFADGRLLCTRVDGHDEAADSGHTYETGSHLDDKHRVDGGHG